MPIIILIGLGGVFSFHCPEAFVYLVGSLAALGHENGRGHVPNTVLARCGGHVYNNVAAVFRGVCVYDLVILRDGYINARIVRKIIDKRFCLNDVQILVVKADTVFNVGSFGAVGLVAGKIEVDHRTGGDGGFVGVFKRIRAFIGSAGDREYIVCLHCYIYAAFALLFACVLAAAGAKGKNAAYSQSYG